MMSGIRGKDTQPEVRLRRALHARGFRFRIHRRDLPGRPDIVLPKHQAAIQVHGCFWHGHDCPLYRLPGTNTDFWRTKIDGNRARDVRSLEALHALGWRTAVVWECAFRGQPPETFERLADDIGHWLRTEGGNTELRGPVSVSASTPAAQPPEGPLQ